MVAVTLLGFWPDTALTPELTARQEATPKSDSNSILENLNFLQSGLLKPASHTDFGLP